MTRSKIYSDAELRERRNRQNVERNQAARLARLEERARPVATTYPSVTRFVDGIPVSVARVSILDGAMA